MDKYSKVVFFFGTKGQFIKTYHLLNTLNSKNVNVELVDTGQHTETISKEISNLNFDFKYKKYGQNKTDISSIKEMIPWFLKTIFKIIFSKKDKERNICIIHGDTASTLLGIIWGKKNNSKILHIESGWRSEKIFQPFPEEIIRQISERFSDILVPDGKVQLKNLAKYSLSKKIVPIKKNTIYDTLLNNLDSKQDSNLNKLLITIHRTENIYNKKNLSNLVDFIEMIKNKEFFDEIVWYCHKPTLQILRKNNYEKLLKQLGVNVEMLLTHYKFINAVNTSKCVLTDGGGVAQEASFLGIPLIIWRTKIKTDHQYQDNKNVLVSNYNFKDTISFIKSIRSDEKTKTVVNESSSEIIADEIEKLIVN